MGANDGSGDRAFVGSGVGSNRGPEVGIRVGVAVGAIVGANVGDTVGAAPLIVVAHTVAPGLSIVPIISIEDSSGFPWLVSSFLHLSSCAMKSALLISVLMARKKTESAPLMV